MTATLDHRSTTSSPAAPGSLASWWRQVAALTRRNLWHVRREPAQLSDATVQPVLFTVLFVYIFGAAMVIPGGTYKQFAIAGLVVFNITTSTMGTAVGVSAWWSSRRIETGPIELSTVTFSIASAMFLTLTLSPALPLRAFRDSPSASTPFTVSPCTLYG